MIQIKRILVPMDFSDCSVQALRFGQELCLKFEADLHLLHVLESYVTGTPQFGMGLALPQIKEESSEAVVTRMQELTESADWPADRNIVHATTAGVPFVEIIRYARESEIDLIVIGTHGRTGLRHVFLGSVAENVVRQGPCPVLTIRQTDHQFEAP